MIREPRSRTTPGTAHATVAAELAPDGTITRGNSALRAARRARPGRHGVRRARSSRRSARRSSAGSPSAERELDSRDVRVRVRTARGSASDRRRVAAARRRRRCCWSPSRPAASRSGSSRRCSSSTTSSSSRIASWCASARSCAAPPSASATWRRSPPPGWPNLRLDDLLAEVLRLIARAVGSRARGAPAARRDGDELVGARRGRASQGVALDGDPRAGRRGRGRRDRRRRRDAADRADLVQRRGPQRVSARDLALDGRRAAVARRRGDRRPARQLGRAGPLRRGRPARCWSPAAERAALAIGRARVDRARAPDRRDAAARRCCPTCCPSVDGLELAARFAPGAGVEVGGDWYDAMPLPSGELAVVIGDVAARGCRAATLMGELRAGLRAYADRGRRPGRDARAAQPARRALRPHGDRGAAACCEPATGRGPEFSSAGSPAAAEARRRAARGSCAGGASRAAAGLRRGGRAGRPAAAGARRPARCSTPTGWWSAGRRSIDDGLERLRAAAEAFDGYARRAVRPPDGVDARERPGTRDVSARPRAERRVAALRRGRPSGRA